MRPSVVFLRRLSPRLGACALCGIKVSSHAEACPGCGQPEPYMPDREDIRQLVSIGERVAAVSLARVMSGGDGRRAFELVKKLEDELQNSSPK